MIPSIDFTDTKLKLNKIFVTLGSKDILALVDTGAKVSYISHAVFNELKHEQCSFYYAFLCLLSLYWGEKTRTRCGPESR